MSALWRLASLLRPYWSHISRSFSISVLMLLLTLPGPLLTKMLIDDVYPHHDVSLLVTILLVGAVISLGSGFIGAITDHFGQCIGVKMGYDLKSSFYQHLQRQDFAFFDSHSTGEVLSRFRDMDASVSQLVGIVTSVSMNTLQLFVFPPLLFFLNWELAIVSLVILPFDGLLAIAVRGKLRTLSERVADAHARLSSDAYETVSGMRTVQALAILSSGINDGEYVILTNLDVIRKGAKVRFNSRQIRRLNDELEEPQNSR